MSVTAKVKVTSREDAGNEQVALSFHADYEDGRNKEWSKYTPALSLSMTVKSEVAERFELGQAFTLTFDAE